MLCGEMIAVWIVKKCIAVWDIVQNVAVLLLVLLGITRGPEKVKVHSVSSLAYVPTDT
jgi:hypothetical protein